ncbi:DUF1799 domain-containing protein [Massilia sp. NR 4-1]|uniref:DUF1799 domain-containing protein n=1 Tax=Massilia sp. NR 4-1 TaxID=1678028 RepID=UPI00067C4DA8|nr:DUF1799 domain-containing protein [Massilia sp. NR 4-1]AKU21873.1 hypothetical protein ACZ75_10735 [Massilia sp. NR 4-1]
MLYIQRPEPVFELWPENETTFDVFSALANQWKVVINWTGNIHFQGLDHQAVRATMELMGIAHEKWPEIFAGLRIMEKAARPILNEKD